MIAADLSRILTYAVLQAQDAVSRQIDATVAKLPDDTRLLDELERAIDDVSDIAVQATLRHILAELDAHAIEIRQTLDNVAIHPGFDPVRIVVKDLASGNL